jgi:hypothetical protein
VSSRDADQSLYGTSNGAYQIKVTDFMSNGDESVFCKRKRNATVTKMPTGIRLTDHLNNGFDKGHGLTTHYSGKVGTSDQGSTGRLRQLANLSASGRNMAKNFENQLDKRAHYLTSRVHQGSDMEGSFIQS